MKALPSTLWLTADYHPIHRADNHGLPAGPLQNPGRLALAQSRPRSGRLDCILMPEQPQGEIIDTHSHQAAVLDPSPGVTAVIVIIPGHIVSRCTGMVVCAWGLAGGWNLQSSVRPDNLRSSRRAQPVGNAPAKHVTALAVRHEPAHVARPRRSLSTRLALISTAARTLFSMEHPRQSKALMHAVDSITPALLQIHASFGIENTTGGPVRLRSPAFHDDLLCIYNRT